MKNKATYFVKTSSLLLFFCGLILSLNSNASSVQLTEKDLTLNAEYLENEDKAIPFFLILHGTFGWHGMELINALQENLNGESYGSLAMTLSLSENNRKDFFDCTHSVLSKHEDAQGELNVWLTWLEQKGYKNINIVGHSRGGAQVAEFIINRSKRINKAFLIAPMVWDSKQTAKSFKQYNKQDLKDVLAKVSIQPKKNLFEINQALHCKNTKISNEAFVSYYDSKPDKNTVELLVKIKNSVYVYLGDSDPLTYSFNQYYSSIPKLDNIVLKTIEDADHYFRDFAAEDIVEDIISHVK